MKNKNLDYIDLEAISFAGHAQSHLGDLRAIQQLINENWAGSSHESWKTIRDEIALMEEEADHSLNSAIEYDQLLADIVEAREMSEDGFSVLDTIVRDLEFEDPDNKHLFDLRRVLRMLADLSPVVS